MSTTFDIIPVDRSDITFGQVIEKSEQNINGFLSSIGLDHTIKLKVNVHDNNEKYVKDIRLSDQFEWNDNEYAWFAIEGVAGGTDAYCDKINDNHIDPANPWWRLEDMELNNKTIDNIKEKLEKSKSLDRRWKFRRSAGQPGIIALSYGLISASIAELTNGILWSDDGAWDYQRFPAQSQDFLDWYFKPEKAMNDDNAAWAKRCTDGIREQLTAPNSSLPKAERYWWQKLFGSE